MAGTRRNRGSSAFDDGAGRETLRRIQLVLAIQLRSVTCLAFRCFRVRMPVASLFQSDSRPTMMSVSLVVEIGTRHESVADSRRRGAPVSWHI
jgi:hypothetical protein